MEEGTESELDVDGEEEEEQTEGAGDKERTGKEQLQCLVVEREFQSHKPAAQEAAAVAAIAMGASSGLLDDLLNPFTNQV